MRTGVFIVQGWEDAQEGINLHSVESYASNLPSVETVRNLGVQPKLDPAALSEAIKKDRLERIVVAGDSPGFFKPVFTRAMALAGGDPDEVRLASFREHGAMGGAPRRQVR